jgi:hypothetical protein
VPDDEPYTHRTPVTDLPGARRRLRVAIARGESPGTETDWLLAWATREQTLVASRSMASSAAPVARNKRASDGTARLAGT